MNQPFNDVLSVRNSMVMLVKGFSLLTTLNFVVRHSTRVVYNDDGTIKSQERGRTARYYHYMQKG